MKRPLLVLNALVPVAAAALLATTALSSAQGISIHTAATAGEAVTDSDLIHSFDNPVRTSAADHNLVGGTDFEMSLGHHLVIYSSRFDSTGGSNRSEIQSNLNLAGVDLPVGWSQGYIRRSGPFETITAGGAIIDVANPGDILQLQSFRTDTNLGAGVARADSTTNSGSGPEPAPGPDGATGIQLLKLDDNWDYLRLAGHDGTGTDQVMPAGAGTPAAVVYNQELENDAVSFGFTAGSGDITLKLPGHYLVLANTYVNGDAFGNREQVTQFLTVGGVEVPGSRTTAYLRDADGAFQGAPSIGMIIETSVADEILNVNIEREGGTSGGFLVGNRTGVSIVKLPDTADYIRLTDTTGQDINATSPLFYDTQAELDPGFTHDTVTDSNRVGVTTTGDYLFFAAHYVPSGDTSNARRFGNQGWQVNGTGGHAAYGQTGRYNRHTAATNTAGNWSGFMTGLNAAEFVETLTRPMGDGGSDFANLALQGIRVDNIFGPDETPPTLVSTTPADEETQFFAGSDLSATFSELIALTGAGSITLTDEGDGSDTRVITLPDAQVSVAGSVLTINPSTDLEFGESYSVQISSDAIEDQADTPNAFGGIADNTTWNFTTLPLDTTAPAVLTLSPADDSTEVSFLTDLVVTFDEEVLLGSGNIVLTNVTDGSTVVETIDVTDDSRVTLATDTLTINPDTPLPLAKNISVRIDAGAVTDLSFNGYAGIADDTTWNFTVEAFPAPVAYWPMRDALPGSPFTGADDVIDDPTHGATDATPDGGGTHEWGADPDRGIVYVTPEESRLDAGTQDIDMNQGFTWSVWVKTDGNQTNDSGADTIIGSRSGIWNKLQVTAWQRWVDIGGYNVDDGQWHHIVGVGSTNPSTEVKLYVDGVLVGSDTSLFNNALTVNDPFEIGGTAQFGEDIAGCISDVAIWNTALPENIILDLPNNPALAEDLTAPVSAQLTPADDDATASTALVRIIFDEPVDLGTGDIRIINIGSTATTTLDVTDGSQVIAGGASLTLQPAGTVFVPGESYAIEIDAGAVTGRYSGLPFAGILDQTTWNFTVDATAPLLVGTDPADEATGVSPSANLVATFDEPMAKGTGNILVKNLTDATTTTIDVTSAEVSVSGSTVTVNPAALLLPATSYAVQVEAGALTDISGNGFAGILDDTTWNFTTGTPPSGLLVYEGFQYADAATNDLLEGQPDDPGGTDTDATGLLGTWDDVSGTGEMFLAPDSLTFGDYSTAGNHVRFSSNANLDIFARDLTADAALGIGGNTEVWFSFLADKIANNFSAAQGGVVLSNQALSQEAQIPANNGADGLIGFGIAPTTSGNNWTAHAWDGSSRVEGDASLSVGIGTGDVRLLVGRIQFDSGTGGADVFTAYEYQLNGGAVAGGTLSQIASPLEIDIDQNVLDTLNMTRRVNTAYDEIRIGTSLDDLITAPVGGDYDVWAALFPGADLTDPSADLDGDGLTNDEERLFGLDPTDPASVNPYVVGLDAGAGTFSFTRRDPALTGLFTDIETSFDLQTWTVDEDAILTVTGPDANGVETVEVTLSPALLTAPELYARVNQNDGSLLSEGFESGDGGFTVVTDQGTPWALGTPNSSGLGGTITTGNGGSATAWGTGLGDGGADPGYFLDPTTTRLRSPVIDLTGVASAELTFAEALDIEAGDTAVVNVIDDTTDTVIAAAIYTAVDGDINSANWAAVGPVDLTPYVGQAIRLEWSFTGFGGTTDDYMGWYVDDISVAKTMAP